MAQKADKSTTVNINWFIRESGGEEKKGSKGLLNYFGEINATKSPSKDKTKTTHVVNAQVGSLSFI